MKISETGIVKAELSVLDIQFLQKYVHEIELPHCYVEIGTRFGGSTLFARLANKDIDIYTIDPMPDWSLWKADPIEFNIHSIVGKSLEVVEKWERSIGVLFIDGNHKRANGPMAKEDFYAWEKFVIRGGIVIFHDYDKNPIWDDVRKDCDEVMEENKDRYDILYKTDFKPVEFPKSKSTHSSSFVILKKK